MARRTLPDGAGGWTYALPDALGSVRQETDATGAVTAAREWSPYGVELGSTQAGLGYTGEWQDTYSDSLYLRARWYRPTNGRFTQKDSWEGKYARPQSLNRWIYVESNPVNLIDPTGWYASPDAWDDTTKENLRKHKQAFLDSAHRHNPFSESMDHNGFAALIATTMAVEGRMGNYPSWRKDLIRSKPGQRAENAVIRFFGCIVSGHELKKVCDPWSEYYDIEICKAYLFHNEHPDLYTIENLPSVGFGNVSPLRGEEIWLDPYPEQQPMKTGHIIEFPIPNPFSSQLLCTSFGDPASPPNCVMYEPSKLESYKQMARQLLDPKKNIEYVATILERGALARRASGLTATPFYAVLWHNRPGLALQDVKKLEETQYWGNAALIVLNLDEPLTLWGLTSNWSYSKSTEPDLYSLLNP